MSLLIIYNENDIITKLLFKRLYPKILARIIW